MGKRVRRLCAAVLASIICVQPVWGLQVEEQLEPKNNKVIYQEESQVDGEIGNIKIQGMPKEIKMQQKDLYDSNVNNENYAEKENYQVTADAYVWDRNVNVNYGSVELLDLKTTAAKNYTRECYFGFDLTQLDTTYVKSAKLKVHVPRIMGTAATKAFEEVTFYGTTPFSEATITWGNKNTPTQKIRKVDIDRSVTDKYVEVDITDYINSQLASGVGLEQVSLIAKIDKEHYNDNTGLYFSSKESNNPAMIEIEKGVPAPALEVTGIIDRQKVSGENITISVSASSPAPDMSLITRVRVNGTEVVGIGSQYTVPLEVGENQIEISVVDEAENEVKVSYTVTRLEEIEAGVYYVDSEFGSDEADGKTPETAWKSIDKLNNILFVPGTTILFKRGGVWTGQFRPNGSGAKGAPVIVDVYGEGARPIFNGNGVSNQDIVLPNNPIQATIHLQDISYWEINNLEVTNKGATEEIGQNRAGIMAYSQGIGEVEHIYIKNCYVHDVNTHCRSNKITGGILLTASPNTQYGEVGVPSWFKDVLVEDCHVKNVAIEGLRIGGGERKYQDIIFRNNLVEEVHGDGIVMAATSKNGLVEKNIVRKHSKCPEKLNYAGCWAIMTTDVVFQYNEVYDGVYGYVDGEAFDFDMQCKDVVFQYNYSHDNKGGFCLFMHGSTNNIFRYNISSNDGNGADQSIFHLANNSAQTFKIYNNTIYIGPESNTMLFNGNGAGGAINFQNNIVHVADGTMEKFSTKPVNVASIIKNNCFYPESIVENNGPSKEQLDQGNIFVNPMLMNPTRADQIMDTWTQEIWDYNINKFKVAEGSPVIDAGVNIENNGGKDIYGNPLYTNEKTDIGAHEFVKVNNGPQVTIEGPTEVKGNEVFEMTIGLEGTESLVYAQDLVLNFDESLFELVQIIEQGKTEVVATDKTEGSNRILLATDKGITTGNKSIKVQFRALNPAENQVATISIKEAQLGTVKDAVAETILAKGMEHNITIVPTETEVDKTVLNTTIVEAEKLAAEAVVGNEIGNYPQAAKDVFESAIQVAKEVRGASANQTEVDEATRVLKEAIKTFEASQIKGAKEDINKDGQINVADLALVAYYYQVEIGQPEWEQAKVADVNESGKVEIRDLSQVANKMLEK